MNRHLNKHFFSSSVSKLSLPSKSTSMNLTIASFIAFFVTQILGGPLEKMDIGISAEDLQITVIMPIITAVVGFFNAKNKREVKAKMEPPTPVRVEIEQPETISIVEPVPEATPSQIEVSPSTTLQNTQQAVSTVLTDGTIEIVSAYLPKMEPPTLGPVGDKVQTNFTKHAQKGNILLYGQSYLWIKMPNARTYVNALLRDSKGNLIQIRQGHENDEDNNHTTTRVNMFAEGGVPMPRGKYSLEIRGDAGSSDSSGHGLDVFEIV